MSDDRLRDQLHSVGMLQRRNGHEEFRIAPMRMFKARGMVPAAQILAGMKVDEYLTAEEIAERERRP